MLYFVAWSSSLGRLEVAIQSWPSNLELLKWFVLDIAPDRFACKIAVKSLCDDKPFLFSSSYKKQLIYISCDIIGMPRPKIPIIPPLQVRQAFQCIKPKVQGVSKTISANHSQLYIFFNKQKTFENHLVFIIKRLKLQKNSKHPHWSNYRASQCHIDALRCLGLYVVLKVSNQMSGVNYPPFPICEILTLIAINR